MKPYLAAIQSGPGIQILGRIEAPDIVAATFRAQRIWPGCGVMPERGAKKLLDREAYPKVLF